METFLTPVVFDTCIHLFSIWLSAINFNDETASVEKKFNDVEDI